MREARAALGLGCCVQLVQRSGKGSGFLGGEHIGQVFVKGRFDLCLGGSQAFRLVGKAGTEKNSLLQEAMLINVLSSILKEYTISPSYGSMVRKPIIMFMDIPLIV